MLYQMFQIMGEFKMTKGELIKALQDDPSPDDITTMDLMRMVESSSAFNFWKETEENIYTDQDGEPI